MGLALSALSSGGSTQPKAGVNFEGMPFFKNRTAYIFLKNGSSNMFSSYGSSFFTGLNNFGTFISNAYTANAWYTVISTAGTKGKLFNVISPIINGLGIIDIEVTIDGKVYTYTANSANAGRSTLGALIQISNNPTTVITLDSNQLQALPASYGDSGFSLNPQTYMVSPDNMLRFNMPYLLWTKDMKVRVRTSTGYFPSYPAAQYAAATYIID